MSFLTGTPGKYRQISTLEKGQQPLKNQLFQSASGAFPDVANYYRGILGGDESTYNALAAPEMRRFNQQIIPDLAEQFAGMGAQGGGLRMGGFQNAASTAGADLAERLGAIRANLRQQAAQGLMGLGQQGLQSYNQNVYEHPTPGLLQSLGPAIGRAIGAFGRPALGALGKQSGNFLGGNIKKGSTQPYQGAQQNMASGQYAGPGY